MWGMNSGWFRTRVARFGNEGMLDVSVVRV